MNMTLKGFPVRPRNGRGPETRYNPRAKRIWDERDERLTASRNNWRFVSCGALFVALLSISLNFYLGSLPKLQPYFVEIEQHTGRVFPLGLVLPSELEPNHEMYKQVVYEFVKKVRGVTNDPIVLQANWNDAGHFVRSAAARFLKEYQNSPQSPHAIQGKTLISVHPRSFHKIGTSNTYQVRWEERMYNSSAKFQKALQMSGTFTVEKGNPPQSEIPKNALGIYITEIHWGKEAE